MLTSIQDKLKEEFGASFVGRINSVSIMHPLSLEHTTQIIKKHINELSEQLSNSQRLTISPDKKALLALAEATYSKELGVRNMERIVDNIIHELIVDAIQKKDGEERKRYTLTHEQNTYSLA